MRILINILASVYLLAVVFVTPINVNAGSDLFISEIGFMGSTFGGGHDKWVEIFNPTLEAIDLADYSLVVGKSGRRLDLQGIVNRGEAFLITTNRKNTDSIFNHTSYSSQQFSWNPMSFLSNTTTDMHITVGLTKNDSNISNFYFDSNFVDDTIANFSSNKGSIECGIEGNCWNATNEFWEGNYGTPGTASYVVLPQPEVEPVIVPVVEENAPIALAVESEPFEAAESNSVVEGLPAIETNPTLEITPIIEAEPEIVAETKPNLESNQPVFEPTINTVQENAQSPNSFQFIETTESLTTVNETTPIIETEAQIISEVEPVEDLIQPVEDNIPTIVQETVQIADISPIIEPTETTQEIVEEIVPEIDLVFEPAPFINQGLAQTSLPFAEPAATTEAVEILETEPDFDPVVESKSSPIEIESGINDVFLATEIMIVSEILDNKLIEVPLTQNAAEDVALAQEITETVEPVFEKFVETIEFSNSTVNSANPIEIVESTLVFDQVANPQTLSNETISQLEDEVLTQEILMISDVFDNQLVEIPFVENVVLVDGKAQIVEPVFVELVEAVEVIAPVTSDIELIGIADPVADIILEKDFNNSLVTETNVSSANQIQNEIIEEVLTDTIVFEPQAKEILEPIITQPSNLLGASNTITQQKMIEPAIQTWAQDPKNEPTLSIISEDPTQFILEEVIEVNPVEDTSLIKQSENTVINKVFDTSELASGKVLEKKLDYKPFITFSNSESVTNDYILEQINPIDYADVVMLLIIALHFEISRFSKDAVSLYLQKFQ